MTNLEASDIIAGTLLKFNYTSKIRIESFDARTAFLNRRIYAATDISRGIIYLSPLLFLQDTFLITHVLLHEVSHLIASERIGNHNHGKEFKKIEREVMAGMGLTLKYCGNYAKKIFYQNTLVWQKEK